MEKFLATAFHQRGSLMREVDDLVEVEARRVVIGEGREVGEFGFSDDILGARIVEEHIVHETAPPRHYPVLATEAGVSDKRMAATVPIIGVIMCAEVVLLRETSGVSPVLRG